MKNKWDERYKSQEYFYGTEPNTFLAENINVLPQGGRILCLAEGEGRNSVFLAKHGFDVTAVDFSSCGLEKLKTLAKKEGVSVKAVLADLSSYPLGIDQWDGIVSIWCHLPSQLRRRVYGDCVRALKPNGVFLLEAYTPEQLKFKTGGPSELDLLPNLLQLKDELAELKILRQEELTREIQEGQGHRGMSAVVQILGVKN